VPPQATCEDRTLAPEASGGTDSADKAIEKELLMLMAWPTRSVRGLAVVTVLAAGLATGCQPNANPSSLTAQPVIAVNRQYYLHEVAEQLGLSVIHTSYTTATLRGGPNTVVLYCDPEGAVYVNGTPLPDSQGVVRDGDSLRVPGILVMQIRSALVPGGQRPDGEAQPSLPGSEPEEEPVPPPSGRAIGRVVVDPGHGGKDPGTRGVLGGYEKDLVLYVGKLVAAELGRIGVDARMTRSSDRFVELEDRPAVANRLRADLFVSIHADSSRNNGARGYTVYVSRSPSGKSLAAASAICRRMSANGATCRGTRTAGYRVLIHSDVPAVLIELGYLSNRADAAQLASNSYEHTLAKAIARGVYDYLKRN